jgi:hypothetical protein
MDERKITWSSFSGEALNHESRLWKKDDSVLRFAKVIP